MVASKNGLIAIKYYLAIHSTLPQYDNIFLIHEYCLLVICLVMIYRYKYNKNMVLLGLVQFTHFSQAVDLQHSVIKS